MNWTNLWIKLFGTTKFMGLDMGFWVSIAVVIVVVILMNVIFWNMELTEKQRIKYFPQKSENK